MASVEPAPAAGDAAHENHPPPCLCAHPLHTGLGHDELTPHVDLHHLVPILLANVPDVPDAAAESGICNQHRYGLVPVRDGRIGEDPVDERPRRLSVRKVGLGGDEYL
ncbi:uncharacterized protein MAM_04912 [Metarhizium album ARSEF 1941]|uniref:Uncharacterized protein n=1 Tax=Metarhizium album (strain ARSEF 1941) TaxID=1081103 RepID=A0A0B2WWT4_METAS|nr:uncharacterized protein MAM_04912 [Metarhizium album ARSEF 1941]KHN97315.1 hypothetical protein MAM_04912 [Metarhizium album ARSEF 1941]